MSNSLLANLPSTTLQVILATAHPAKFAEAVQTALESDPTFNFNRDVMPKEFEGLLDLPRRMFDVSNDKEEVKTVVAREVERLMGERRAAKSLGASV